jgi:hypothetical protein
LAAAQAAGGEVGQWARAHGIDGRSLNTWRMNLGRRGEAMRGSETRRVAQARRVIGAGLVELVPAPVDAGPRRTAGRYVLWIGDARLEFGDDFGAVTLRRLIEVLRSC